MERQAHAYQKGAEQSVRTDWAKPVFYAFSPKAANDGNAAGLLAYPTSPAFPSVRQWHEWTMHVQGLQQRELPGIFTRFPFNLRQGLRTDCGANLAKALGEKEILWNFFLKKYFQNMGSLPHFGQCAQKQSLTSQAIHTKRPPCGAAFSTKRTRSDRNTHEAQEAQGHQTYEDEGDAQSAQRLGYV